MQRKKSLPLSRVEISLLFEGCIRHTTLWQLMAEKKLCINETPDNPTGEVESQEVIETCGEENSPENNLKPKVPSLTEVINHMVILQPSSQEEIQKRLKLCCSALKDDLSSIERVAKEISEDAAANGCKYIEVGLDPTKFVSDPESEDSLSFCDIIKAALKGFKAGEGEGKTKVGLLLQCERGQSGASAGLVTLCESLKDEGVVGIELTCSTSSVVASLTAEGGTLGNLLFSEEDIALMEQAKEKKIHRSVQAGEFGPAEMVFQVTTFMIKVFTYLWKHSKSTIRRQIQIHYFVFYYIFHTQELNIGTKIYKELHN